MSFRTVGQSFTKPDAMGKVTGKALYAGDLRRPAMLFGKVVRSPYAHARVRRIDVSPALAVPGVVAVLTAKDIPGENRVGMSSGKDQAVLAGKKVRFLGEAVAVVAADSRLAAAKGAYAVRVEYDELPVVESIEQGLAAGAPLVRDEGNLCWHGRLVRGSADEAIQKAAVVIRGEYRTQPVEHAYIEPEAVLAEPEGDGVLVWSGTKSVHLDQREIARVLGWPTSRVHVVAANLGGNFGGKPDVPLNCMAALLCQKTGRPVSIVMEREESLQASTKRHPAILKYTHAADADGRLLAVTLEFYADAGGYVDYTPAIMQRALIHGSGPYRVDNVRLEAFAVLTNNPSGGAMRGFGVPQVAFACERQMDRLAQALSMDPLALRLRNVLQRGDRMSTGQVVDHEVILAKGLEKAKEIIALDPAKPGEGLERHSWGIACFYFGNGRTSMSNPGVATFSLLENGRIRVAVGSPDVGQGSNLILAQIAAEALGLEMRHVEVITGDTASTPDSGTTSGTRLTAVVGRGVQLTAEKWRDNLLNVASELMGMPPKELTLVGGAAEARVSGKDRDLRLQEIYELLKNRGARLEVTHQYDPPTVPIDKETGQGSPYAAYTYGVQLAKVRVNRFTGKVDVDRLVSILDVGRVINPLLLRGQVEGGTAISLGYALLEEVELKKGKVQNPNFDGYLLPTAKDVCEPEVITIPTEESEGPYGAKGVGEPSCIPGAAAIANAVCGAIGEPLYRLPLSLERVADAANSGTSGY